MRIQGRVLRPSTLAERRVVLSLGDDHIKVRRGLNPFVVARHVRKLALGHGGDLPELRTLLARSGARPRAPEVVGGLAPAERRPGELG